MPRYRANLPFGPWHRGEEFESTDEFHARLATEGKLLTIVGEEVPRGEPVVSDDDEEP